MTRLPAPALETATRQFGLITTKQLRGYGVESDATQSLVRRGRLTFIRRGLYGLPGTEESRERQAMAACLHTASPCVSGLSAASFWGLWNEPEALEVSVRYPKDAAIPGVVVHRSRDIEPVDITLLRGIRITTPSRTLCDLGRVLPETAIAPIVDHALTTGLVNVGRLRQIRIRNGEHGRNGVGVLGRILEDIDFGPTNEESGPELTLGRILVRGGLPRPVSQYPVTTGGRTFRIDLAYPQARIAIEYDGEQHHSTVAQLEHDRRRQALLERAGWYVLRFRNADLVGPARDGIAARVGALLQQRQRFPDVG